MFSEFFSSLGASLFSDFEIGGQLGRKIGHVLGEKLDDYVKHQSSDTKKWQRDRLPLEELKQNNTHPERILPKIFGTVRLSGQVIWLSDLQTHQIDKEFLSRGGWGNMPTRNAQDYTYSLHVAIAIAEGEIDHILHIYVGDRLVDISGLVYRFYRGSLSQTPDSLIQQLSPDQALAFVGTSYVVIENIPIEHFNHTLPVFEFLAVAHAPQMLSINNDITALCLIPASGEFTYSTTPIVRTQEFQNFYENKTISPRKADMLVTIDQIKHAYPNVKHISLVVSWFFDHLDASKTNIYPAAEYQHKQTQPYGWQVGEYTRQTARLVSQFEGGNAYGGTPCDLSVQEAIIALTHAGYEVTFYPFLMGDISPNHPDNVPAYPWRGRVYVTGNDAEKQQAITRFFNLYTQMVTHYADMIKNIQITAGKPLVKMFVIASELRELTRQKIGNIYPAVTCLKNIASTVRGILSVQTALTYAADWTEYGAMAYPDGSLDFPLDDLWASPDIDYVGLDWYPPLSDWRDSDNHLDKALSSRIDDVAYLQSRIEAGEGYDFYYQNTPTRKMQTRTPISEWVYRVKDIRSWWHNLHYPRIAGGIPKTQATPWQAGMKPIIFTELGCPAVDKGSNAPNVFPDRKSSENAVPFFSSGKRHDGVQAALIKAYLNYWQTHNSLHPQTQQPFIKNDRIFIWCLDARPYPAFPYRADKWKDADAYEAGHWIMGRGQNTSLKTIIHDLCQKAGVSYVFFGDDVPITGYLLMGKATYLQHLYDLVRLYQMIHFTQEGVLYLVMPDFLHQQTSFVLHADQMLPPYEKTVSLPQTKAVTIRYLEQSLTQNMIVQKESYPDKGADADEAITISMVADASGMHDLAGQMLFYLRTSQTASLSWDMWGQDAGYDVGDRVLYQGRVYVVIWRGIKNQKVHYKALLTIVPPQMLLDSGARQSGQAVQGFGVNMPTVMEKIILEGKIYVALYKPVGYAMLQRSLCYHTREQSTFDDVAFLPAKAIMGQTITDFYNRPVGVVDLQHALWISLPKGVMLQNATSTDIQAGRNLLLIKNAENGLWELIGFEQATLVDPAINKYHLQRLYRGLKNTASAMASPVPAGSRVIIMNDALWQETEILPAGVDNFMYKVQE